MSVISALGKLPTKIETFFANHDMPVAGAAASSIALVLAFTIPLAFFAPSAFVLGFGALYAGAIGITAGVETAIAQVQKSMTKGTRNEAGQTVVGSIYDLKRLDAAQTKIDAICSKFNAAADDVAKLDAQVARIVASVEPLRSKVQIFDGGAAGVDGKYAFRKTVNATVKTVSVI